MGIPGEKTKFFIMSQPGLTAGVQGRLDATGCDLRADPDCACTDETHAKRVEEI